MSSQSADPCVSNSINLPSICTTLRTLALEAGSMILSASESRLASTSTHDLELKKNSADLVTETDKEVEHFISKRLLSHYPTFSFMGEETWKPGTKLGDEPTFIVDPIDGTTNFVHGWPYVSVSLGLAVKGEPVVGVVYNPFSGRLYRGVKGGGSFVEEIVNGEVSRERKLPVKQPELLESLDGSLVAIEWGSDRSGNNWVVKTETWAKLGRSKQEGGSMVHSARALGSAALNLCAVAEGTIDLYWEGGCWAWDVCAGWVILKEAGGMIVDGNPGKWSIPVDHRKYLAVKGMMGGEEAQKRVVEEFWAVIGEGRMEYES